MMNICYDTLLNNMLYWFDKKKEWIISMKDNELSTHMRRNPILFTAYGVRRCQYCVKL